MAKMSGSGKRSSAELVCSSMGPDKACPGDSSAQSVSSESSCNNAYAHDVLKLDQGETSPPFLQWPARLLTSSASAGLEGRWQLAHDPGRSI